MRASKPTLSGKFATLVTLSLLLAAPAGHADLWPSYALVPTTPDPSLEPGNPVWQQFERIEAAPTARPAIPAGRQADDLLAYLRQGFSLSPVMNDRVQAQLSWFVRNPEYLERVFLRSQRYLPYITSEIERRGLPLELALLPIVESAYDPFAYSHGRAAGLWQIIPGTARRFGIRQNWWYDGRRDVVDSTGGALDYLAYLHDLMQGDWLLAVASYNSGEGNVQKAVRANQGKGRPTDFWNLHLSKETSSYVPKLMALVEIVRDPAAFGVTLPEVVNEPQFIEADVGGQLDLALAAEIAGLDLETLYAFNAGFNRWATDPDGPHRLILPVDYAQDFVTALESVPPGERVRWQRHKIKPGESISEIADQYHTPLASIKSANNLKGNTIRAGDYLMIPVATKPLSDYSLSAEQRREDTQNRKRQGNRLEHVVASGESFWSIGQRYGVGTRELAAWNGVAPRDTLSIGQKLVIWTDKSVATTAKASGPTTRKLNYTVRSGDSLYLIASRFRISVSDLERWNNINKDNILRPGQKLTMYVDVTRQSS
ncbi:MAG: LysM peptidoglycan-binding domain-containing protein [Gammaproteobacteria bacterium]|nr:LysM peptidoglycan-binding domain-containing protein [Gammaproteobacteria bacterium]